MDLKERLRQKKVDIAEMAVSTFFFCLRYLMCVLSDVCAYLGEISLHVLFIAVVDDVNNFFHFGAYLFDLVLGVGVEKNLTQQSVVF